MPDNDTYPLRPDRISNTDIEFKTTTVNFEKGAEQRTPNWSKPKRTFTLEHQLLSRQDQQKLIDFYIEKKGSFRKFYFCNQSESGITLIDEYNTSTFYPVYNKTCVVDGQSYNVTTVSFIENNEIKQKKIIEIGGLPHDAKGRIYECKFAEDKYQIQYVNAEFANIQVGLKEC